MSLSDWHGRELVGNFFTSNLLVVELPVHLEVQLVEGLEATCDTVCCTTNTVCTHSSIRQMVNIVECSISIWYQICSFILVYDHISSLVQTAN